MVQPNEKGHLEKEIKGDEISDESTYIFNNGREGKYHPIGEPLGVFDRIGAINGFE
jgi:hypothetical protein